MNRKFGATDRIDVSEFAAALKNDQQFKDSKRRKSSTGNNIINDDYIQLGPNSMIGAAQK